jgi:hypothetical protein
MGSAGFSAEEVARLIRETSKPLNDGVNALTGAVLTLNRGADDQQMRTQRLYEQIDALQRDNAELRSRSIEAERLRQQVELEREKLAHTARHKAEVLATLRQVSGRVVAELAAARQGPGLPPPIERAPGNRTLKDCVIEVLAGLAPQTMDRVAVELLEALSPEMIEQLRRETAPALLVELMQLLGEKPEQGRKEEESHGCR